MAKQSPEEKVISILQATHEFALASREALNDDKNPLEEGMQEALGELSLENLLRLGTKQSLLREDGAEEAAHTTNRWGNEEIQLQLGQRARKLYVARQNLAIAEILGDQIITLSRHEDAPRLALATEVSTGFQPAEGPVKATFMQALGQHGRIDAGGYVGHFFAGPGNEPVLDLRIGF